MTPRITDSRITGFNGVVFVHQGAFEDSQYKFTIAVNLAVSTQPIVLFTSLQVYHPYVDLMSGQVQPECILKGRDFWQPGGLLLLVQEIQNLLNDTATLTGICTPGVTLANPEAAALRK